MISGNLPKFSVSTIQLTDLQESPTVARVSARHRRHLGNALEVRKRTFWIKVELVAVQVHPRS